MAFANGSSSGTPSRLVTGTGDMIPTDPSALVFIVTCSFERLLCASVLDATCGTSGGGAGPWYGSGCSRSTRCGASGHRPGR
jgi:hypothetical protein